MTLTAAQANARLASLVALRLEIQNLIALLRQDTQIQGVWIEGTPLSTDEPRLLAAQKSLLAKTQADATAIQ